MLWPGRILVEHKSLGSDLGAAMAQALDYLPNMPESEVPRLVVVCDFDHFNVRDLDSEVEVFMEFGEPMILNFTNSEGVSVPFKVLPCPVSTGEAVIACSRSEIRDFLKSNDDKTLIVKTEARGIAEAFYAQVIGNSSVHGWLAIRGISDHVDETKNDAYHRIASRNAATVLERLLPYLRKGRCLRATMMCRARAETYSRCLEGITAGRR